MGDWLKEAKARCEAATPGPWWRPSDGTIGGVVDDDGEMVAQAQQRAEDHCGAILRHALRARNALFIAAARTDLPRAITALEAADALSTALEAWPLSGHEQAQPNYDIDQCPGADKCSCGWSAVAAALAAYREARK